MNFGGCFVIRAIQRTQDGGIGAFNKKFPSFGALHTILKVESMAHHANLIENEMVEGAK